MKKCNECKIEKELTEYFKDKNCSDGHYSICKKCKTKSTLKWRDRNRKIYNEGAKAWRANNRFKCRQYSLKQNYGITPAQYEKVFEAQNGRCAICLRHQKNLGRRLSVDHCHWGHRVRELLCSNCNKGLGNFQEDSELLRKAAEYLEKHRGETIVSTQQRWGGLPTPVNRPGRKTKEENNYG